MARPDQGGATPDQVLSPYYDDAVVTRAVAEGRHREIIGGLWDELGKLQLDFLIGRGLTPGDRLLDVGCGSLRAGVHLIQYLDTGGYFGIDLRPELLDAGYDLEVVPLGLADRLPRDNLRATEVFDADFAAPIDVAIATSVFTHLPIDRLRLCLDRLASAMRPGARFFVTYFEGPEDASFDEPLVHQPGGITTFPASDPYHHRRSDMLGAAGEEWAAQPLGAWGHPRAQLMALYTRSG